MWGHQREAGVRGQDTGKPRVIHVRMWCLTGDSRGEDGRVAGGMVSRRVVPTG